MLENTENPKSPADTAHKSIDTQYVYVDANDHSLIIENSYPKGGLKYTDFMGREYMYAIFWTRITNRTTTPLELAIEFPNSLYPLSSSSDRSFRLLIPSDTMTPAKETLFNYGLDLKKTLDNHLDQPSTLKKSIGAKDISSFYVVTLFNKGVGGVLRTGLRMEGQKLFYYVNGKEIECGSITWKR
ncbi:hypothetical protein GCM10023331_31760 [Algivirga pacifica]|uniref:Uncharacterized protein n=2 Tax=Algivirga pacifica TaxID=1162670 RepID=A0ABP9DIG7_9BACT